MKNFKFLLNIAFIATTLLFIGCNKDDESIVKKQITLQDLVVAIDENTTNGQTIGTVQTDENEASGFSVTSQTPAGALSIDSGTGELTVADASLFDFETNPVITATVSVEDGVNTATVTINLNDVAEIGVQDLTIDFDENPTNGQTVGTVLTDGSGVFSIASQTPAGALSIDSNTGELTVADTSLFDFETNPVITATVSVEDGINTATVTINLTNVAEINVADLTIDFDENPTNGQTVGTVLTDGSGVFSITSQTPAGALNIDATTGELTVANAALFDFETNSVITATVSVVDGINTATATINLNNINEIGDLTIDFDENPTNGQVVGTVPNDGSGVFSITSQTPAGALSINSSTGELTVTDATLFDFETNPVITATISVDGGIDTATATINLNNINEIGDFNHGGVVFWIDPIDNTQGLVLTINNQANGANWGCSGVDIPGASGTAIGTGATNTVAIEALCATTGIAADIAANLSLNGYDDWFLPSQLEWSEVHTNLAIINTTAVANGGVNILNSNSDRYWTSTVGSSTSARAFRGSDGTSNTTLRIAGLKVRSARAF